MPESLVWSRKEDRGEEFARECFDTTIKSILSKAQPSRLEAWVSGTHNFRYSVAKTRPYKGNRAGDPKPKYLGKCIEWLAEEYEACNAVGEADDEISIRSREIGLGQVVVCSIDKDLLQIPAWHYNWVQDKVFRINHRQADFNLYQQILTGDTTDNIPGLERWGPVKAKAWLEGAESSKDLCKRTWEAYAAAGKGWDYLMEQADLVYILRHRDERYTPPYTPSEVMFKQWDERQSTVIGSGSTETLRNNKKEGSGELSSSQPQMNYLKARYSVEESPSDTLTVAESLSALEEPPFATSPVELKFEPSNEN
jgi:hypothetical protein